MDTDLEFVKTEGCETGPGCSGYSSMVHSKKVIKHALRQQAKRRRKNTTIAAGNSRTLPRIVVKPLPLPPPNDPPSPVNNAQHNTAVEEPAATMKEVLASLPGFSLKSGRRRSTKRLSATAQLEAGLVDLESPASILASTSLRALLNRHTFQGLPPLYQRKLAQLLPAVDRQDAATSGLNNEFFARACLEWRKRLAEGEFTPENQQRLKMEAEKDKNKLDPWKVKHFEPIWGEKREPKLRSGLHCIAEPRHSGAVTRSSLRLRLESNTVDTIIPEHIPCPVVISEEKIEGANCKKNININVTEELNGIEKIQKDLLLSEYNKSVHSLDEEKYLNDGHSVPNNTAKAINNDTCLEQSANDETDKIQTNDQDARSNRLIDQSAQAQKENIEEINQSEEFPITPKEKNSPRNDIDLQEQSMDVQETNLELNEENFDSQDQNMDLQDQSVSNCVLEVSEEDAVFLPKDDSTRSSVELEPISTSQLAEECVPPIPDDPIYQMPHCETVAALESNSSPPCNSIRNEVMLEEQSLMNGQSESESVQHESVTDGEAQIPEGMEIDSETLQRIHELEVRGEMREAYEEISGCPEEIIYPILDGMEIGSSNSQERDNPGVSGASGNVTEQDASSGNEDEALRDANNYVCSEMLECSWTVDPTVNNVNNNTRPQEELQVPWPLVAASLDGSVAANITVTTQDDCNETSASTESVPPNSHQQQPQSTQFINAPEANLESINCIQLPVVQGSPFPPEGLAIAAANSGPSCVMKNLQPQSPPIIAFPQLQSIRFVQTSFHPEQGTPTSLLNNTTIPNQLPGQSQNDVEQINTNNVTRNNVPQNHVPTGIAIQTPNHAQGPIVVHQQQQTTTNPLVQPRQIVATVQHQQQQQQQQQSQGAQFPIGTTTTVSLRTSRASNQGNNRGPRGGNKEQGGSGRSRSTTKEPPGAVNLERSYQICQAVIQSSPNRDQLKAHLKPPPSLLARSDGAFTTNKSGGRTVTTIKTQKQSQQPSSLQHNKQHHGPNKAQPVMLRHLYATTRQPTSSDLSDNNPTVAHLGATGTGGLGQYILVQRTGVGDSAPRASSAPPLPPQIAGVGMGVHLVRGRPASAGEGSHQAVTLKARGTSDGRGTGGAEPGAPGLILGGDPPPPCECNMRGAMVICRQCGAFCHDDCIGPQRICATCLIR